MKKMQQDVTNIQYKDLQLPDMTYPKGQKYNKYKRGQCEGERYDDKVRTGNEQQDVSNIQCRGEIFSSFCHNKSKIICCRYTRLKSTYSTLQWSELLCITMQQCIVVHQSLVKFTFMQSGLYHSPVRHPLSVPTLLKTTEVVAVFQ